MRCVILYTLQAFAVMCLESKGNGAVMLINSDKESSTVSVRIDTVIKCVRNTVGSYFLNVSTLAVFSTCSLLNTILQ